MQVFAEQADAGHVTRALGDLDRRAPRFGGHRHRSGVIRQFNVDLALRRALDPDGVFLTRALARLWGEPA